MDQLFSVHFFVRNIGKIVPQLKKNSVLCKSIKTDFTVLKDRSFFCDLREKFRLYRFILNTVNRVFVDLIKKLFFLSCGTIFPIFLTKNVPIKVDPINVPLFQNFEKFCRNTRTIFQICPYTQPLSISFARSTHEFTLTCCL